ncbi:MAG: glycine cleavage system protein R [Desulfuromonas sp.]|uniref:glycine cleavage system protein R n=1 Tax=Desulfuromonas thiophila TaxID=57664 RepID=UPI0024A7A4F6|nr:ACT domain-containing protein [Desulfuromonas thiophila]MDY0399043.1 ACT domain-containing protein [Desulfuromonas thiophila]
MTDTTFFAVTIIGRDRPGIVADTARVLYELGCNVADSSSTILGGQFAMILIVSHPQLREREVLLQAFSALEQQGLSVFVRTLRPGGETRPELPGELCMISVYGSDKAGIVYRVAQLLSDLAVNIVDLNTKLVGSAQRPVYVMMCESVLPENLTIETLRERLEPLRRELQVDISVRNITPVEL